MKHRKSSHLHVCPAYPNAASREYYVRKLVDAVTAIISGIGILAVLIFFFLL